MYFSDSLQAWILRDLIANVEEGGGIFTENPVGSGNYEYTGGDVTMALAKLTNLQLSSAGYIYLGDPATNGTFRFSIEGTPGVDGKLVVHERVSGSWVKRGGFTGYNRVVDTSSTAIEVTANDNGTVFWVRNPGSVTVNINAISEWDTFVLFVNVGGGDIQFSHAGEITEDIVDTTQSAMFFLRQVGKQVMYTISGTKVSRYGDFEA